MCGRVCVLVDVCVFVGVWVDVCVDVGVCSTRLRVSSAFAFSIRSAATSFVMPVFIELKP